MLLFTVVAATTQAEEPPVASPDVQVDSAEEFDAREFAQALFDSELPREVVEDGDDVLILYELENGGKGMPAALTHPQPRATGGRTGFNRFYIDFTPTEQQYMAQGGIGTTAGVFCAATRSGCIGAGAIAGMASQYVSDNGICSNQRTLRVTFRLQATGIPGIPPVVPTGAQCR
ncbi:MAG: hypothetical protein Q3976_08595 [Corynebacterium sp.]|nr:hypothetical protein [Corynebacterium sp.]